MAISVGEVEATLKLKDEATQQMQESAEKMKDSLQSIDSTAKQAFQNIDASAQQGKTAFEGISNAMRNAGVEVDAAKLKFSDLKDHISSFIGDPLNAVKRLTLSIAEELGPSLGSVGMAASVTGGIIAGVAGGMFELADSAATLEAHLEDMTQKTGMSGAEISRLDKAAQVAGTSIDMLSNLIFMMDVRMQQTPDKFADGLQKIGINFDDFMRMSPYERITALADAMSQTDDASTRNAAGFEMMGRMWRNAGPELMKLNEAMQLTQDITPATGEELKRAEQFEMHLKSWKVHVEAFIESLGRAILKWKEFGDQVPQMDANGRFDYSQLSPTADIKTNIGKTYADWTKSVQDLAAAIPQANQVLAQQSGIEKDLAEQHRELKKAADEAAKQQKEWAGIVEDVTFKSKSLREQLDSLDGNVYEGIRYYLERGVAVDHLAKFYGVTKDQVEAVRAEITDEAEDLKNTAANMKTFEEVGVKAAEAVANSFKGMSVLKDLAIDMGNVQLATDKVYMGFQQLMPDMSQLAVRHMGIVKDTTQQLSEAMGLLSDSLSRLGQTIGGTFGSLLTGMSQLGSLWASYQTGKLTGTQFGYGAAGIGSAAVAQAFANPSSTGGYVAEGAAQGASVGVAFAPYTAGASIGVGAGVGALIGWIASMKEWRKVASDFQRDFNGLHMSDDLAKAISDVEDQTGLGRAQATLTQLDKIIQEAGGLNAGNFEMFYEKLRSTFAMLGRGEFDLAQVTQILDKNFAQFAAVGTDAYGRVNDAVKDLIYQNQVYGTQSQAVIQFLQTQGMAAVTGFVAVAQGILSDDILKKWADLKTASKDNADALAEFNSDAIAASGGLQDLGIEAVAAYTAAVAAGKSQTEAMAAIHPALLRLEQAYDTLGISVDDVALKQLMLQDKVVTAAPEMITAIDGLSQEMIALDNMGLMNKDTFEAMQRTGETMFERLQGKVREVMGADASLDDVNRETLIQMQKWLHMAADEAEKLGLPLDENTQKMIDQSKALGIWQEEGKSSTDQMIDGMKTLIEKVQDLIDTLRGIPPKVSTTIDVTTNTHPGPGGDTGDTGGGGKGSNQMASGGYFMVTKPTLFTAGEAGPEYVEFSGSNKSPNVGGGGENPELLMEMRDMNIMLQGLPSALSRALKVAWQQTAGIRG